jgi:hypothetical protein
MSKEAAAATLTQVYFHGVPKEAGGLANQAAKENQPGQPATGTFSKGAAERVLIVYRHFLEKLG